MKISQNVPCCPSCFGNSFVVKRRKKTASYLQCKDCSLVYVFPVLTDNHPSVIGSKSVRTKDAYNRMMIEAHALRVKIARSIAERRVNLYARLLGYYPSSIMDVGCGDGAFYSAYTEMGISWRGLDINGEIVHAANRQGVPVELQDFLEIADQKSADVVFASQVLEHFSNPNDFMVVAKKVLVDGGILHVDVPNHESLVSRARQMNPFGRDYGFIQEPYHLFAYSERSLSLLFRRHGFHILILKSVANDDPVLGQLVYSKPILASVLYRLADALGMGSLLVCIARKI